MASSASGSTGMPIVNPVIEKAVVQLVNNPDAGATITNNLINRIAKTLNVNNFAVHQAYDRSLKDKVLQKDIFLRELGGLKR